MSNRLRMGGLLVLLAGVLLLVITGYARPLVVVPLFRSFELLQSLSHAVIWVGALLLVLPLAWRSLRPQLPRWQAKPEGGVVVSRTADWLVAIQGAQQTEYEKWLLVQDLRQLVMKVLAERERVPEELIWQRVQDGTLPIPLEVRRYLKTSKPTGQPPRYLRWRPTASHGNDDLAQVVHFLSITMQSLAGATL